MKRVMLLALTVILMMITTPAKARTWSVDNDHSQAVFTIGHVAGKVTGFFNHFTGTIIDPDMPGHGMIDVQLRVGSLNSGIKKRDAHLMTPDFFDSATHPHIHFTSTKITARGDGWFNAHGVLTIRNTNRSIILPFILTEIRQYPALPGKDCTDVLGIQAHFSLNRLDFGVGDGKFHRMGVVDDVVGIVLQGELLSPREGCQ